MDEVHQNTLHLQAFSNISKEVNVNQQEVVMGSVSDRKTTRMVRRISRKSKKVMDYVEEDLVEVDIQTGIMEEFGKDLDLAFSRINGALVAGPNQPQGDQ